MDLCCQCDRSHGPRWGPRWAVLGHPFALVGKEGEQRARPPALGAYRCDCTSRSLRRAHLLDRCHEDQQPAPLRQHRRFTSFGVSASGLLSVIISVISRFFEKSFFLFPIVLALATVSPALGLRFRCAVILLPATSRYQTSLSLCLRTVRLEKHPQRMHRMPAGPDSICQLVNVGPHQQLEISSPKWKLCLLEVSFQSKIPKHFSYTQDKPEMQIECVNLKACFEKGPGNM